MTDEQIQLSCPHLKLYRPCGIYSDIQTRCLLNWRQVTPQACAACRQREEEI